MATRTGHAWIDKALDAFVQENPSLDPDNDHGFESICLSHTEPDMHLLADGTFDHTRIERFCILAAQELVRHLEDHGIEAYTITIHDDFNPFSQMGYGDRLHTNPEIPGHMVVQVFGDDDEQFIIDYTAGQFGYREWPMIQRSVENGPWERTWPGVDAPALRTQAPSPASSGQDLDISL